jgi:hypothetical protein
VWDVLSELFLDTEFVEDDYNRIVKALASSPYSIEELEDILRWEVYAACYSNMFSIAGEWAGFNMKWLESRITRGPSLFARFWTRTAGGAVVWWPSWRKIRRRVAVARRT